MRARISVVWAMLWLAGTCAAAAQDAGSSDIQTEAGKKALLERVIANQKKNDEAMNVYERVQRQEIHKNGTDAAPEIKVVRAIPAGTGVDHIPLGSDGKPGDEAEYRAELEKLARSLTWAAEDGRGQRDAYDKIAKKQKERNELIDATRSAFLYTFVSREPRGDRMLAKFRMEPNPGYKATSRSTSIFSKVRGFVWIDELAAQVARVDVEVTDDFSIGGFLAKIYKGSHLMQERYQVEPELWMASYSQYDFDGRRLFMSFGVHERTFYSQYRRIGPPKEALAAIRAELGKSRAANADP